MKKKLKKQKPTNRRTKRQTHRFHAVQRLFCRRQRRHRRRGRWIAWETIFSPYIRKFSTQPKYPNSAWLGSFVQYVIRNVLRMTRSLVTSCMQSTCGPSHHRPRHTSISFVCSINKTRETEKNIIYSIMRRFASTIPWMVKKFAYGLYSVFFPLSLSHTVAVHFIFAVCCLRFATGFFLQIILFFSLIWRLDIPVSPKYSFCRFLSIHHKKQKQIKPPTLSHANCMHAALYRVWVSAVSRNSRVE